MTQETQNPESKDTSTEKPSTEQPKISEEEREKRAKELIQDFLKVHGDAIIETTIQYTKQNGLGALFLTLNPYSSDIDIEYFKAEDLDGNFKKKIMDNPNNKNFVYYAIKLHHHSYIFERDLGESVEEYVG